MNPNMLIEPHDKLKISFRKNEDGTNNGSIFIEKHKDMAYCMAKAPKFATKEEWENNADLIIKALEQYFEKKL